MDDYNMNIARIYNTDPIVGCHYSYSGYYDTGGCNGAYCRTNANCVSGCCWEISCQNNPQCDASNSLAWFWWVIIWTTFCFLICILCAAMRRRRYIRMRAAANRNHSDNSSHDHHHEHNVVIAA